MESVFQVQAGARPSVIVQHCFKYGDKAAGLNLTDFMPYQIVGAPDPVDNSQSRRSRFDRNEGERNPGQSLMDMVRERSEGREDSLRALSVP